MIAGVVLAAGRSSRMGSPKALLTLEGETFVGRIVRALRAGGCDPIVVVTGSRDDEDFTRVADEILSLGVLSAINPDPGSEQIDSLRLALQLVPAEVEAVIMTPVDAPGATPEIVRTLVEAVRNGAPVAVPVFGGRRGHPVAFARGVIPELLEGELPEGARTVLQRHDGEMVEVALGDPAVLLDVDTWAEYQRLREERG